MTPLTLPTQRVDVDAIIQCAMDMEAAPFLAALSPLAGQDDVQVVTFGDADRHQQRFTLGVLEGKTVLVVESGIGLANAAAATARALTLVDAPEILVAGTIGGLHADIRVGQIAAGVSSIYNGADATIFGYELGQVPRMPVDYHCTEQMKARLDRLREVSPHPVMIGRVISGDVFAEAHVADGLRERFSDAMGTDMETTAIAQVCYGAEVDWVCLRAVSDIAGAGSGDMFHMNGEDAARHSFEAVCAFLTI